MFHDSLCRGGTANVAEANKKYSFHIINNQYIIFYLKISVYYMVYIL
jgi:hypothetical protein